MDELGDLQTTAHRQSVDFDQRREPGPLLRRCYQRLRRTYTAVLGKAAPTPQQLAIMIAAYQLEEPTQARISERTGVDRNTISEMVSRLVDRGLLKKRPMLSDSRAWELRLTKKGNALVEELVPLAVKLEEKLLAPLTEELRPTFVHCLRLVAGIGDESDEPATEPAFRPTPVTGQHGLHVASGSDDQSSPVESPSARSDSSVPWDAAFRGDLRDRVVIVTGAGQGIGRCFARAFAAAGAVSIIPDLNGEKARSVAAEITAVGGRALSFETDVGDADSIERMTSTVIDRFGRIDVLINNAAIFSTLKMRPFFDIPLDEWQRVLHVNVTGAFLCCRAVLPIMRKKGWGRIINMSSGAVTLGRPNYTHYTTSKAALIGMTRSLARELGPFGITVNAILPGATFTEIERETVTPEGKEQIVAQQCVHRPAVPDDLVGTVMFLASEDSAFLTGQSLTVDGGATHL